MESYHPYSALALTSRDEDRTLPNAHRSPRRTAEACSLEAASSSGTGGPGHTLEDDEDDVSPSSKYPDYCRTLQFRDSNGGVKELVFPKALDLDRPKRARTTFSAEQLYKLEREFQRNQYLVGRERTDLADNLQLSETQVKVWFQNRRTKYKRDNSRQADERKQHAEGLAACNILRMLQQNSPPVPTKNTPPGPPSHPAPVSTHSATRPPIPIALSITNRPVGSAMMSQTTFGQMPFSHQTTSRFHFPPPPPPHLAHVHAHSFPSGFYTS